MTTTANQPKEQNGNGEKSVSRKEQNFRKYSEGQIRKFEGVLKLLRGIRKKLNEKGYRDIRQTFVRKDEIMDLTRRDCGKNSITLVWYDGTVECSPVDDYALAQIDEMIGFAEEQLKFFQGRVDGKTVGDRIRAVRKKKNPEKSRVGPRTEHDTKPGKR